MINKVINTRIQLRYDTYTEWMKSQVPLLQGEVALCFIPANTEGINNKEDLVMHKIGNGLEQTFKDLPWASATAFYDEEGHNILATYAKETDLQRIDQEYIIVNNLEERNMIDTKNRIVGMRVYVIDNATIYIWTGDHWNQSLDSNNLLSYFDSQYFKEQEGKIFLQIDTSVTQGSQNLITSGAVYTHVENIVGVIDGALQKI